MNNVNRSNVEYIYNGRLETDESFKQVESFIVSEIEAVKADPEKGKLYLYKTGMYDKNGNIKAEFI